MYYVTGEERLRYALRDVMRSIFSDGATMVVQREKYEARQDTSTMAVMVVALALEGMSLTADGSASVAWHKRRCW